MSEITTSDRVKNILANLGYQVTDSIRYENFLDMFVKLTGKYELGFTLAKKKRNITPQQKISFFDLLPLYCNDISCTSNKGQTPTAIIITPIEMLENLTTYGTWCPVCIKKMKQKQEEENKRLQLELLEDQEVEINQNVNRNELKVEIERGRGSKVTYKETNKSFIEDQTAFGGNIKQSIEDIDPEAQNMGSFEAINDTNVVASDNMPTEVIEVKEDSATYSNDTGEELKKLQEEYMQQSYDDTGSVDDKIKELKRKYALDNLKNDSEPNSDTEDSIVIKSSNEIPQDIPNVIDPSQVRRRKKL